ncbi:carbohydrate ABC transporter permease [Psychrobacillus antarcticus]|uniref:carbohydrate ABC transporter permease n=1 Tax=Psychrobacillus antarcticus TaxID=2879115 RepID=UPI002407C366|nr:sugar ABC transporter permease [Psychrobacillus antarcticus]
MSKSNSPSLTNDSVSIYKWKLLFPLILILFVILVFPLGYSLWLAFHDFSIIDPDSNKFVGNAQFQKVLTNPMYWTVMKNTFLFVLIAVSFEVILGVLIALALSKQRILKNFTRAVILAPMFVTPIAVGLMFRFILNNQLGFIPAFLAKFNISIDFFGSNYTLLTLALIDVWQWTPFIILMILSGLESLPQDPFEAAYVEGASKLTVFLTITLPLLKPVLLVAILIRSLDALKVFEYVYAITKGGPGTSTETLQFYIHKLGFGYYRLSEAAAVSWTVVVIIMIGLIIMLKSPKKEST